MVKLESAANARPGNIDEQTHTVHDMTATSIQWHDGKPTSRVILKLKVLGEKCRELWVAALNLRANEMSTQDTPPCKIGQACSPAR